jgi:hypothetical protein
MKVRLELFGIAQRACSCTPPATAPLITPQLCGASPGTRVEEIATVARDRKGNWHA